MDKLKNTRPQEESKVDHQSQDFLTKDSSMAFNTSSTGIKPVDFEDHMA